MSLSVQLSEMIQACFTGIWVESHEHEDALAEIAKLCSDEKWNLVTWHLETGLSVSQAASESLTNGGQDPLAAIRSIQPMSAPESTTVLVLQNFHKFLQSNEIIQALAHQLVIGKQNRTFILILSPIVNIPVELEKMFVVVEHSLPSREQLIEIARSVATEPGELPDEMDQVRIIDAAVGLTRYEAEGAFSLSLVRHGQLRADVLWDQKAQLLKKQGQLQLHRGTERFEELGGLDSLKAFCLRVLRRQTVEKPLVRPRGVLLLSPPGCGKSQFAKSLGTEIGRPTLTLDIGSLMGSLVGESERNLRQALRIVDAMAPCILFCDELEKGLSGINSNGDSGVSARLFGHLLTWLNDHTSDVFFVGTCNDISRLPPEFARAERFDAVVFIDLPTKEQRDQIWKLYLQHFGITEKARPNDDQWTGAEIKACCRLAALLDVPLAAAAQNIVPIAVTAAESVTKLRTWASGRCLSADRPGIYQSSEYVTGTRRKFSRNKIDPSQN